MKKLFYILIFFVLIVNTQAQEVYFKPDTTRFLIGEQVNFSLSAKANKDSAIVWPVINDTIDKLEVIERSLIDTTYVDDYQIIKQNFKLTNFDSGSYVLNPVRFQIGEKILYTKPKMIEIYSVEVDTTKQKLFPIKKNIEVGYSFSEIWPYLLLLLLVALIALLSIYFYRRHINREKVIEEVKIAPFDLAIDSLKKLDADKLIDKGEVKEFYVRLSDILRRFIEDEHNLPAMESTTDEIMDEIKYLDISKETNKKIKEFLVESDFVKFAKYKPELGKHDYFRKSTEEIIVQSRLLIEEEKEDE